MPASRRRVHQPSHLGLLANDDDDTIWYIAGEREREREREREMEIYLFKYLKYYNCVFMS